MPYIVVVILSFVIVLTAGCSDVETRKLSLAAGDAFMSSQKDGVVRNWQQRVRTDGRCDRYREALAAEGSLHASTTNASFHRAMGLIRDAARSADCWESSGPVVQEHARNQRARQSESRQNTRPKAYRWRDAKGEWHLADQPPAAGDYEVIVLGP